MRGPHATPPEIDADVAIVGYGPVAQALAGWLGAAGHSVVCVERFQEIYRLPRAVHLDHEIMRLLQRLGVTDELAGEMLPVLDYHWFGADGEPLMVLQPERPSISGWEPDYLFFQPALESVLDVRARASVQEGTTSDQIFTVAEVIAWLSRTITLRPGDIIATGTPAGIGAPKGLFLKPGNSVTVEVEGLGAITNPVAGVEGERQ